jgi:hypothetical protein
MRSMPNLWRSRVCKNAVLDHHCSSDGCVVGGVPEGGAEGSAAIAHSCSCCSAEDDESGEVDIIGYHEQIYSRGQKGKMDGSDRWEG